MKSRIWIEGSVLIVLASISLIESLRLILYKDSNVLYDPLGPGWYVFAISIFVIFTSITYMTINLIKLPESVEEKGASEGFNEGAIFRFYGTIGTLGLCLILIDLLGYFVATFIFFVLSFWVIGVKPWVKNIVLSIIITGVFWIVFVKYCTMVFPSGIFLY